MGVIFGLAGSVVTTSVGLAFVAAKGYHLALATATIVRYAVGAVLGGAILASIGTGLGALLRNQIASIITLFAWGFGVEQIVGSLFSSTARFLPFMAADTMAGATSGAMPPLPSGLIPLPFAGVVVLLLVVSLVIALFASRATVRRDIV